MRILIFGTGKVYERYKAQLRDDIIIVGFLDNDKEKQGKYFEGKKIYSPQEAVGLEYDLIFLMSIHHTAMREQLVEMGINDDKIYDFNRPWTVFRHDKILTYGDINELQGNLIAVFSHALTSTGAQNVLFQAAVVMKKNNYNIVVISRGDGVLREKFIAEGIAVIVCEDIITEGKALDMIKSKACMIWINTVWLYDIADYFGGTGLKTVWWIHESARESDISKRVFRRIASKSNIRIMSVSPVVDENIWHLYGEDIKVERLFYGLKDYNYYEDKASENKVFEKNKIVMACIGGVSRIKGQDFLIKVIDCLPEYVKEKSRFLIIGAGTLDDDSLKIVAQNDCIEVIGEVDNSKMPYIYQTIDGIICCSRQDAMPVVVAEACMNMKFSIVSDAAGISRLLTDNKNALIFKSENIEELQEKIMWVVNNYQQAEKIGQASRSVYDKYFSLDIFEKNLIGCI